MKTKELFPFILYAAFTKTITSPDIKIDDSRPDNIAKSLNAIKIQVPKI